MQEMLPGREMEWVYSNQREPRNKGEPGNEL